ncbi:MAG: hypothetical protein JWP87_5662 [Labilithrix sp.]|nr:hypothetical protein [Labilithrix sp.]
MFCAGVAVASSFSRVAHAVDLPKVDDSPVSLEVTETSIVAQRFNAREGENENDQGYFAWLNRLNAVLGWKKLTLGVRLDSSLYALRPEDRDFADPQFKANAQKDGATRYRDAIYPAKVFLTYKTEGIEVTAGDAYVQFGRGLVLSMRKVDELGIDTTLLGAKIVANKDIFGLTLIGGIANPARVDEPSGRALFLPRPIAGDRLGAQPLFGNDRIVGASITAGRGLPVVLSTNGVILSRCAPYSYNPDGTINDSAFDAPFGTCNEADRASFLGTLSARNRARQTINASQTLEVPNLWGHGNFYLEGAVQQREPETFNQANTDGNALYGSFVASGGPITNTVEMKSYRNFYPLAASVNVSRASAFGNIAYSAPPTAEPVIADTMFFDFNACATGARDRLDYRLTETLLVYGTFGYFVSKSEQPTGQCDRLGRSTASDKDGTTDLVTDASVGAEWRFDDDKSIAFFNVNGRHDVKGTGATYYDELSFQYSITKYITGPYSIELAGRHRYRKQERENIRDTFEGEPWRQGEHQTALKVAPKWILSQGIEYTTQVGLPTYYFNGGILYRFTSQSNIRLYAGQNRGGLRCVSGICRQFPAFSGARAELTLRF